MSSTVSASPAARQLSRPGVIRLGGAFGVLGLLLAVSVTAGVAIGQLTIPVGDTIRILLADLGLVDVAGAARYQAVVNRSVCPG